MSELKNSQRINYKATYVQAKLSDDYTPHAEGGQTAVLERRGTGRAVEKSAFVQALRVTSDELRALRNAAPARGTTARARADALYAVGRLINDRSVTSTLNNAKHFAAVTLAS